MHLSPTINVYNYAVQVKKKKKEDSFFKSLPVSKLSNVSRDSGGPKQKSEHGPPYLTSVSPTKGIRSSKPFIQNKVNNIYDVYVHTMARAYIYIILQLYCIII